jgi:hypothetical protein
MAFKTPVSGWERMGRPVSGRGGDGHSVSLGSHTEGGGRRPSGGGGGLVASVARKETSQEWAKRLGPKADWVGGLAGPGEWWG